jgi:gliding motility-associated-like protein
LLPGCVAIGHVTLKVFTKISVPNAFTPNGDGRNDIFYALGGLEGSVIKDFAVYDRWGEMIFKVKDVMPGDPASGWDGNFMGVPSPVGAYVYIITVQLADNTSQVFKGTVVLIR